MQPHVFREYDIRGHAERDFVSSEVTKLGAAFAATVAAGTGQAEHAGAPRPVLVLGRDCRTSSPRLATAFIAGARVYCDVVDIGEVATPLLYFAAKHLKGQAGVMITGSHNPPDENGFKLVAFDEPFFAAQLVALRQRVQAMDHAPEMAAVGALRREDVTAAYLSYASQTLRLGAKRMRVVIDGGNGMGGGYAQALYQRLGFDVIGQYVNPDGTFPHHHPDPSVAENLAPLIARVTAEGADLGLAFDGDGDRLGVVDGEGRILWGDQLMILLGKHLLTEVPNAKFIGEVKCSQTMFDALAAAGGDIEMAAVGHSRIKQRVKQTGAHLAGEMSGHLFFAHRYLGFDDGIYAGARVLEMLSHTGQTLAQLAAALPPTFATPELRLPCPDAEKFAVIERCREALANDAEVTSLITIDGVRANVGGGWFLLRASNTGPVIVMRCEATTQAGLDRLTAKAHRLLDRCAAAIP